MEKKLRVLVIDDETITLRMTKQGLEKLGYDVAIFSNPIEALSYFEINHKDLQLVISDKSMPQMQGSVLLKKFREINKEIPIIILTGFLDQEEDKDLLNLGATKILMKPISIHEINEEIKALF